MNRRSFIQNAAIATAGLSMFETIVAEAGVKWTVGCFNRPWTKWSFAESLDGIKAAGYSVTGLLTTTKEDHFTGSDVTQEYLKGVSNKLKQRGLRANMCALKVRSDQAFETARTDLRKQIDNASFLKLEFALTFGVDKKEEYENYFKLMSDAAAYSAEKKVKLVMKPHGGASGASSEILAAIKKVGHRNFKIWYDAGNIIYYTGKDPVAELMPIIEHVTGFCAKDCAAEKSDVMIQFGDGKVNFNDVFAKLKSAGFHGPIMVECCKVGATPQETARNAEANRLFLEKVLKAV